MLHILLAIALSALTQPLLASAQPPQPTRTPLGRSVDLNVGQSDQVKLSDGSTATVKLLDLQETRDTIINAVREARVKVEVNGQIVTLTSATYHLPVTVAGVQIDCPITKGYTSNSTRNAWALVGKDARLRLWPASSPLIEPGTFVYPLKQRWMPSLTQMANEPVYVNVAAEGGKPIYYHDGLDFGGAEGLVEVVCAADALIVSVGEKVASGYETTPARPRYDVVYTVDDRGWYYRYSHLHTIDTNLKIGDRIKMGQRVGLLGKEGGSGGWSHLHFGISAMQPSGQYGTEEAYAYVWEAYRRQFSPKMIALARPAQLAAVGQRVTLDGSRSWAASGKIARYEWTFTDGTAAATPTVQRTYDQVGTYSEILKVTDEAGNVAYDFACVQICDPAKKMRPAGIHAVYFPTTGIKAGDTVTFKVRSFNTTANQETWDFGDGTPPATTRSDGNVKQLAKDGYAVIEHRYAKPGSYLVRVERINEHGHKATARLHVFVE